MTFYESITHCNLPKCPSKKLFDFSQYSLNEEFWVNRSYKIRVIECPFYALLEEKIIRL